MKASQRSGTTPLANQLNTCYAVSMIKEQTSMTHYNPYVQTLIEMGYDEKDCQTVAVAGIKKTFPLNIYGRIFETEEEYKEALADFINGI